LQIFFYRGRRDAGGGIKSKVSKLPAQVDGTNGCYGTAQKQIHVLRRRNFGRRRGMSETHTPPVSLKRAAIGAATVRKRLTVRKLFLPDPEALLAWCRPEFNEF
jgi:hypothetical protein